MVKNLGRGFFYTIGRMLAMAFIGLVIATLLLKLGGDSIDLPDLLKGALM